MHFSYRGVANSKVKVWVIKVKKKVKKYSQLGQFKLLKLSAEKSSDM